MDCVGRVVERWSSFRSSRGRSAMEASCAQRRTDDPGSGKQRVSPRQAVVNQTFLQFHTSVPDLLTLCELLNVVLYITHLHILDEVD